MDKFAYDSGLSRYFRCSLCGYGVSDLFEDSSGKVLLYEDGLEWKFCPNCGARIISSSKVSI